MKDALDRNGFIVLPGVVAAADIAVLIDAVEAADVFRATRGEAVYGARNLLAVPAVVKLARTLFPMAAMLIGSDACAVRGIFFDKTPGANWPVAWHQDLTLAVAARRNIPGWTNWSIKAGVHHVQPPPEFLDRMVTLRLQLDDCGADNGPLKVLRGTHRLGRIPATRIVPLRGEIAEHICTAPAGSALAFKPLLLHASSPAKAPRHRRVIHLEYAPEDLLPPQLRWLS
jgi:ectoine hydroxylase-related dioxygenase (phytanoyl-CoA dioxygenase family)